MVDQATTTTEATDPIPSRNPQGIPFRVPTRSELIKYVGDYAEAYRSEQHDRKLSKTVKTEVLSRASQRMSTAIDYLYGRLSDLVTGRSAPGGNADG